jgi:Icc-related predicted phosphoesterase
LVTEIERGLFVAGIGWHGERHYELPGESDLEPVCHDVYRRTIRKTRRTDRLVLLTHYPAHTPELFEPSSALAGWTFLCVRKLVEQLQPVAVVQGHVHEWFDTSGVLHLGNRNTFFLNPGPHGRTIRIHGDGQTDVLTS